ncbi:Alpha-tocopherol transfer protein-like [Eumeta japonica]|uniref:Alpha-tocopherol transfer protein-like n=1 Tax=Eumeta variegata TaxID=151549 RepID=A0A4C1YIP5_EUMVA|nr:Alpha-tocopherol transfer protein-like [Eumeta japonica]
MHRSNNHTNVDTKFLELFVRGCRMDFTRTRSKFEAFWRVRARYADLYQYRSLNDPPLANILDFIQIVPLPRLTDEGLRVTVFRLLPGYPERAADVAATVKAVLLVSDARMHDEHAIAGDIFLWDVGGARGSIVAHVASAANALRRGVQLAHAAYPQRLKCVHVFAAPAFLASTIQLLRSFMSETIRRRFRLHSKLEQLQEYISLRVLPSDFGGEEESLDVLSEKWRRRVGELHDYLRNLNEITHETSVSVKEREYYGAVGAFRKLEID